MHSLGPMLRGRACFLHATSARYGMTEAVVALGSNLGDRQSCIRESLARIEELPGTSVVRVSTLIETDPVGPIEQGTYLNGACLLETDLDAMQLLAELLTIERELGRERDTEQRWGPRTIDLDLLIFGDQVIDEPGLTVPHPRISERLFVLEPMNEIVPELIVPPGRLTVHQLYQKLTQTGEETCS
ncbi:MAG: 2-amino-4-hydroxy-6-hydroxymethyldihydropteridine diphosphokinase [Phycisphaerales bacterium]